MNKGYYGIDVAEHGFIYQNPFPQLRSLNAYFPSMAVQGDGSILAGFALGEAFESVDLTTVLSKSTDSGKTWSKPEAVKKLPDRLENGVALKSANEPDNYALSDFLKLTVTEDGKILTFGYEYIRENPMLPIGNPETGGVLDSRLTFLELAENISLNTATNQFSIIRGPELITSTFTEPVEASAPICVLKDGSWVTPTANFFNWEGKCTSGLYGRLLRSDDRGMTWNDDTITMEFPDRNTAIWEQRLCQLENGNIVVIAWNEELISGKRLPNHYTISKDGGKSFCKPLSTGIMGQASNIIHIGDNKVLALHCLRRDTDRPGIYGYIVNLSNDNWDILCEQIIWEPSLPVKADRNMAEVFSFLKFGQPSAVKLKDGSYLTTNWVIEGGIGKIAWHKINL